MNVVGGHLSRKTCKVCSGPLTVHQEVRGGVCDAASCRHRALHAMLAEQRRAIRREALSKHGFPLNETPGLYVAQLPVYHGKITNLPEKRRRRFRDHLLRLIGLAAVPKGQEPAVEPVEVASTAAIELRKIVGECCATCQGWCCQAGSTHAYLKESTVRGVLAAAPGLRPRQVLDAYLSYLPAKSYEGSCVFHTATGCALPRSMRSDTCKDYFCAGVVDLIAELDGPRPQTVLAAAASGWTIFRSRVIAVAESEDAQALVEHKPDA